MSLDAVTPGSIGHGIQVQVFADWHETHKFLKCEPLPLVPVPLLTSQSPFRWIFIHSMPPTDVNMGSLRDQHTVIRPWIRPNSRCAHT